MLRLLGALIALGLSSVSSKDISYCSECTSIRPSRGKYSWRVYFVPCSDPKVVHTDKRSTTSMHNSFGTS